jgi:kynurenine formamidase
MEQHRAIFDAEVTFANGGGLQCQDFRLDIVGDSISDEDLATLFLTHLGLLLAESVRITRKSVIAEPHKGSRGVPRSRPEVGELIELSHPINDGMITCPGLPGPDIGDHLTFEESRSHYASGTEFHIGRISMVANTGTYIDTPAHRYNGAPDLSGVGLDHLANLAGVVVQVPTGRRAVDRLLLAPYHVRGMAVLIHTGWDEYWGTPAYGSGGHPFVTLDGAVHLVEAGAALVGIDSVNIDDTDDGTRPAHSTLLAQGIPVVEHLCGLDRLPPDGFRFHAVPPMIRGLATFPVRAYAVLGST